MVIGYAAIRETGEILIKTVSETERAVKVNYLVVYCGVTPLNSWSDKTIELYFGKYEAIHKVKVKQVDIAVSGSDSKRGLSEHTI